jgi:hypothetical protein
MRAEMLISFRELENQNKQNNDDLGQNFPSL